MPEYQLLNSIDFQGGINASAAPLSPASQAALSDGSWNCIVSGDGFVRGFAGLTSLGAGTGSRKMLPFGKTFGGIRDLGLVKGAGSFFEDIGRSRWGVGAGQASIEGTDAAGFVLSTLLQVSVATGGVFAAPVRAGLTQPSAPELGIVQTAGDVSNAVSAKIERRRPATGDRSLASPTSAVVTPSANRLRVTFPAATVGQTHWRAYFTFQGFGGLGVHYLALYGLSGDIPETIVAAGSVEGIARSLEFNFQDGDLLPVEASYDDYPPPAATHALKLQNVLNLAGCYADAAEPTSINTGTAIAVSKINNYGSYIPTHLLFLPEQVTDTLARPIDDYGYVACENSIHAIQYVGYRGEELPPCTITTILPDIGILYPHNWATSRGKLLIYSAEGTLIMMDEQGAFDTAFAGPVTKIIKDWAPAETVVGFDPKNDLAVIANGSRILVYSFIAGQWRQIWLPDYGIGGRVMSCATARRRLYLTIAAEEGTDAGSQVYSFDTGSGEAPLAFAGNYQNQPSGSGVVKNLTELAVAAETGAEDANLVVCINKNLRKTVFRRISATGGSSEITDAENGFSAVMVGKKFCLFAAGIDGPGTEYLRGRIAAVSSDGSTAALADEMGAPLIAQATAAGLLMYAGEYVAAAGIDRESRHFPNFFPLVTECRSYQIAVWLKGGPAGGNILTVDVFGSLYASTRAQ